MLSSTSSGSRASSLPIPHGGTLFPKRFEATVPNSAQRGARWPGPSRLDPTSPVRAALTLQTSCKAPTASRLVACGSTWQSGPLDDEQGCPSHHPSEPEQRNAQASAPEAVNGLPGAEDAPEQGKPSLFAGPRGGTGCDSRDSATSNANGQGLTALHAQSSGPGGTVAPAGPPDGQAQAATGPQRQQQQPEQADHLNPHASGSGHTPLGKPGEGRSPQLRINFLDLPGMQGMGHSGGRPGQEPRPSQRGRPGSRQPGEGRRARGGLGPAVQRGRDERIRQLVLSSCTLLQLRGVVERHLRSMSPFTAAIALSRFTDLAAATHRLRAVATQGGAVPQQGRQAQGQAQGGSRAAGEPAPGAASAESVPAPSPSSRSASRAQAAAQAALPVQLNGSAAGGHAISGDVGSHHTQDGHSPSSSGAPGEGASGIPLPPSAATTGLGPPPGSLRVGLPGPTPAASLRLALAAGHHAAVATAGAAGGADTISPASTSPSGSGHAAPGSGAGSAAAQGPASRAPGGRALDGSSRVHPSSLALMRRMVRHIALSLQAGNRSGPAAGRRGAAAPARPTPAPAPAEHRARVAGIVLGCLARVELRASQLDAYMMYALLEAAKPDLFLCSPQQLCRLASTLPPLGLRPAAPWLDHFCSVARSKMYAAGPGQLAAYVWMLARLGHHPGELWLHTLAHHMQRGANLASASPGQLCQLLWSLHHLGFRPDPEWRAACTDAVTAAVTGAARPPSGRHRSGVGRLAASASVGDAVGLDEEEDEVAEDVGGEEAVEAAAAPLGAAARRLARRREGPLGGSPGDVASLLLWAVRTGTAPEREGVQSCLERLQPGLRSLRRVHLLRLLLALAEAGHCPEGPFMERLLACMQPKLRLLNANNLTQLLLALRQLRYVPSQSWLMAWLQASRSQLRHYAPSYVTATYQAFAAWHLRPGRSYLEALHAYADSLMPRFGARGLAVLLSSMSSLGVKPQRRWLARALDKMGEAVARAAAGRGGPSSGGGGGGWGGSDRLAGREVELDEEALAGGGAYLPAAQAGSPRPTSVEQRHRLRQEQRAAAASALVTVLASLRGVVALQEAAQDQAQALEGPMLRGEAAGRVPTPGSSAGGTDNTKEAPAAAAPALLPYELWGPVKRLTELAAELLDAMSGQDLMRLLNGLLRLNFYPGREFLAAHSRATLRAGPQLAPEDKDGAARAYAALLALAPHMAAEARRQAATRQARTSVLLGSDPWAAT